MLRLALAALMLAAAGCGGGGGASGPAVVAGAPAGDVTAVSGTVTATREGATRTLAQGDVVAGDDVIETGADGRIVIQLRHNLVPWTLGAGRKEQVAASLAWRAPRATAVAAGPTGERSGAAGRHAEREAADTAATALAPAAAAPPGGPSADEGAAPPAEEAVAASEAVKDLAPRPPPRPAAAPRSAPAREVARDEDDAREAMARAEAERRDEASRRRSEADAAMRAEREAAEQAAAEQARATRAPAKADPDGHGLGLSGTGKGGGGAGGGLGGVGTVGGGAGPTDGPVRSAPAPIVRVLASKGALELALVTRVVRVASPRLGTCVAPSAPARAMIKLTIKPDGKVDSVVVSGVSATSTACVERALKLATFPTATGTTTATVLVQATK